MSPRDFGKAVKHAVRHPLKTMKRIPKAIAASANYASRFHQKAGAI